MEYYNNYEHERKHECECEEKECKECNFCEIEKILRRNLGRVVTVYTETGGMAGRGFTGLVAMIKDGTVKFITSIPSAPFEKFSRHERCDRDCNFNLCEHCRNSHFGSALIIPICKIVAVSVVEI